MIKIKKYLPLGTVVLLKGAKKRVMITGFSPTYKHNNENKFNDYIGCFFPEGIIDSTQVMVFNHEDIENIFSYGLVDDEQIQFMEEFVKLADDVAEDDVKIPKLNNLEVLNVSGE